jgi:tyrosyl-DNA phosphodiesterase-1
MCETSEVIVLSSDDEDAKDAGPQPKTAKRAEPTAQPKRNSAGRDGDDDDDDEDDETYDARDIKRRKNGKGIPESAPIKLFATHQDLHVRTLTSDPEHWSRSQCLTLREMLGYDGSLNGRATIDWMVVSNFLIDFEFLINEIPELLSLPRCVVFYGEPDTPPAPWLGACPDRVDFRQLRPSDPPNSPTNPLRSTMSYGVHHTKAFLVGLSSGMLRVVIHTSNLRKEDVHLKTQAAYIQDFPLKASGETATAPSDFENDLVTYFESYGYKRRVIWGATGPAETLSERLRAYDYSGTSVVLIPSIPGYHPSRGRSFGHLKLRHAISAHASPTPIAGCPIVCQFSSIGSLNEKYLLELQRSMDASQVPRSNGGQGRPWDRLAAASPRRGASCSATQLSLRFVYPTMQEICDSVEGPEGGKSVPGRVKNLDGKAFLKPLLHKWAPSAPKGTIRTAVNPLWKSRNVPHVKTYYQLGADSTSMQWFVVSSHNLSMAAWGTVIHPQFCRPDPRLMVRSWELGVFVSPSLLQRCTRLVPWSPDDRGYQDGDVTVPLPYKLVPELYGANDLPWAVDRPLLFS